MRHSVGRALSDSEKLRLIKAAAKKPEWQLARLAMTLALNTTMRASEIKGLRWRDVNSTEEVLTICRSKTAAGERVIPLNSDAKKGHFGAVGPSKEIGRQRAGSFCFPGLREWKDRSVRTAEELGNCLAQREKRGGPSGFALP